jgi:hypothetical protein
MTDLDGGACLKKELLISVDDGKTFLTSSFPDKTADLHVCLCFVFIFVFSFVCLCLCFY